MFGSSIFTMDCGGFRFCESLIISTVLFTYFVAYVPILAIAFRLSHPMSKVHGALFLLSFPIWPMSAVIMRDTSSFVHWAFPAWVSMVLVSGVAAFFVTKRKMFLFSGLLVVVAYGMFFGGPSPIGQFFGCR